MNRSDIYNLVSLFLICLGALLLVSGEIRIWLGRQDANKSKCDKEQEAQCQKPVTISKNRDGSHAD